MEPPLQFGSELSAELGVPEDICGVDSSPRSRVWRAELAGTPVVIKQLVGGRDAADGYAREVAALRTAARVDPPVVPALLGTDPRARMLVLEYVEHQEPQDDWLIEYATALARLHAAASAGVAADLPVWSGPAAQDVDSFLRLAYTLEVTIPPGVRAELEGVVERLARSEHRALLHGDPCPGNDLHTATGVRFIDFEQAAVGNGLMELAYLHIGFPTCWCATAPAPRTRWPGLENLPRADRFARQLIE